MNEQTRRLTSLTVLGVLMIAVLAFTAISVTNWLAIQSQIETAEARAELPPAADPQRYLLQAESHGVAGANFQSRLRDAAQTAGLTINRQRTLPAEDASDLRVVVELEASGEISEIAVFLHSVESTTPALIVATASFRPERSGSALRMTARIEGRLNPGAVR